MFSIESLTFHASSFLLDWAVFEPMCSSSAQAMFSATYTQLPCGFFTQKNKCLRLPGYSAFPCMPSYLLHTREKAVLSVTGFNPLGIGETSFLITHSRPAQERQKEEKGVFPPLLDLLFLSEPLGIKDNISFENPGLVWSPFPPPCAVASSSSERH